MLTFSDSASKISGNSLLRATTNNKNNLVNQINNIYASGGTNYEAAFTAAFQIFNDTRVDEIGSPCQNIILFLTDGAVTAGETNSTILLQKIRNLNNYGNHNATIFTYGLGNQVTMDILI